MFGCRDFENDAAYPPKDGNSFGFTTRSRWRTGSVSGGRGAFEINFMRHNITFAFVASALLLGVDMTLVQAGSSAKDLNRTVTYLLDFVAKSDCTFIRNGTSYPPKEASEHLKAKRAFQEGDQNTRRFHSVGRQQESCDRPSVQGEDQRRKRD